ncbi:hypothetical protein WA026_000224 [Henosepilachna vigintioctopunctata]|uniref:Gamma-tubulin complex component 6 n=1 Tax=Henosepilachna vigintioctopunctata TaxID=420089 RepID=A0AAW1UWW5_9CUCU
MESDNSLGIFDLISSLCEKFSQDPSRVKLLRSKCYEVLLRKRTPVIKKKFRDLSTEDPVCNLLAWRYVLSHHYKLVKCSELIAAYHDFIYDSYKNDNKLDTYHNILKFLLSLRDIPSIEDDQMDLSLLPNLGPCPDFHQLFKLSKSMACHSINYLDSPFYFKPKKKTSFNGFNIKQTCSCSSSSNTTNSKQVTENIESNEERNASLQDYDCKDIWEIAATEKYSWRRNWENYGLPEPEKEPIFLSELGDLSSLWIDNLHSIYLPKLFKEGIVFRPDIKCKKDFIRDLKYLLIGLASQSFTYNDFGELVLIPEITLEGITEDTLEVYSKDFTLGGTCYKALYEISIPDLHTNKYRCSGFIFAELCESLNKYLRFYRTAIMSMSDSINLLDFTEKTSHLRKQIITLASICKVGPYKESEEIPHGVDLLNYLYQKITEVIDRKIILVLYSILYPCCQIYFGRFILQWILDGSINDPHDEFFIKTNYKYISTKGRTYWTRSFVIREEKIPDFLSELKENILLCGKMMNLLKQCNPFSKLCIFLMGKKPQIISCCITRNQLILLQQSAQTYYLEAVEACGPKISLPFFIQKDKQLNEGLLDYIYSKRAATLHRIEVERQKSALEEREKKLEERAMLKEQYDMALQQKQFNILQDIEREIKIIENSIQIEEKRQRLIQQEAKDMVEYYEELFRISDSRREKIEKHIENLNSCQLDPVPSQQLKMPEGSNEEITNETLLKDPESNQSEDDPNLEVNTCQNVHIENVVENSEIHSSQSLDELNANIVQAKETIRDNEVDSGNNNMLASVSSENNNYKQTLENFEIAKKNKRRVMNEEMGMAFGDTVTSNPQVKMKLDTTQLTDAQKNKLKVMSSEFDIKMKPREIIEKELTVLDVNKYRMMTSTIFEYEKKNVEENVDNDNIRVSKNINKNQTEHKKNYLNKIEVPESKLKKSTSLSLNFNFKKDPENFLEVDKSMPMSVDSTPLSEITNISTPASRLVFGEEKVNFGSFPTTACTEMTDDGGFKFNDSYNIPESSNFEIEKPVFSKVFSSEDVKNIKPMCLKMFLSESLSYSLATQSRLVSSELLKYFLIDLKYLQHLKNLKYYFFLQDGEFGRTVTETLFQKLYNVKFPMQLMNCRVLSYIIHAALEDTGRSVGLENLSFKINSVPDTFNLGDVDVLSCLSLTYKVDWPLNILLPCDAVAKYNDVFKFLLKIYRMNWILKKMFGNLRMLAKETGVKQQYLMMSVHYRRIHLFRYVMLHFVQTLQNYITGEVFQTHWVHLEKNLETVTNLDELYDAHTCYLKNILFMCLLNQRSAPLKKVFEKIFTVILKFYDHLRSKKWTCKEGTFIHPSYSKLETIFENFNELVLYLFKVGKKVVKNGYQPHFQHFLNSLNTNNYYSKEFSF